MDLAFARYRGSKTHAATHNGRVFIITTLGPKNYRAEILRLSHQVGTVMRPFRTFRAARRWLEREAGRLARRQQLGQRTPIVAAILKGE